MNGLLLILLAFWAGVPSGFLLCIWISGRLSYRIELVKLVSEVAPVPHDTNREYPPRRSP